MTADGLRLAVGTLTAVPVPAPVVIDGDVARSAMVLAPVAVLPLGIAGATVGALGHLAGLPPLVAAALLIAVVALGSRGLHLDGLADTADGLSASYDGSRALEIMRRGNTGPMGAATLALVLLVQTAAAAAIVGRPWGAVAIGGLVCVSRLSLLISCVAGVPSARPDGLGRTVAGVVPRVAAGVGAGVAALLASGLLVLTGSPWWLGVVAVAVAAAICGALVLRCTRRFGGITGDVLGAGIELTLAALLVVTCSSS
jgi:adenosylcobinamide-GDP ribazoletransferase